MLSPSKFLNDAKLRMIHDTAIYNIIQNEYFNYEKLNNANKELMKKQEEMEKTIQLMNDRLEELEITITYSHNR